MPPSPIRKLVPYAEAAKKGEQWYQKQRVLIKKASRNGEAFLIVASV